MEEITGTWYVAQQKKVVFNKNNQVFELVNADEHEAPVLFMRKHPVSIEQANVRFMLRYTGQLRYDPNEVAYNIFRSNNQLDYLAKVDEEPDFPLCKEIRYARITPEADGIILRVVQGQTTFTIHISSRILTENGLQIMQEDDYYEHFIKINLFTTFSGIIDGRYRYYNNDYWAD